MSESPKVTLVEAKTFLTQLTCPHDNELLVKDSPIKFNESTDKYYYELKCPKCGKIFKSYYVPGSSISTALSKEVAEDHLANELYSLNNDD